LSVALDKSAVSYLGSLLHLMPISSHFTSVSSDVIAGIELRNRAAVDHDCICQLPVFT